MWEIIKKNVKFIICIAILIPIIIYILSVFPVFPSGNNDWSAFWGSYLGAIIGGVITLYVMKKTIDDSVQGRKREEKIEYFNNMITITAKLSNALGNLCKCITRCMADSSMEVYDKSLEMNNLAGMFSLELEMLIETRKDIYKLDEIICAVDAVVGYANKMMDYYADATMEKFKNKKLNQQLDAMQDELLDKVRVMETCIKQKISENLSDD